MTMSDCTIEACDLYEDGPSCFSEKNRVARKLHKCSECGRVIDPGETYHYESGVWDGTPLSFKTCADCYSLRREFFSTYEYGSIWASFEEAVFENDGRFDQDALAALTPAARERAMAAIERAWERIDYYYLPYTPHRKE